MKKEKLKQLQEINMKIVASNSYLHNQLMKTEKYLELAESEILRKETIINYLEIRYLDAIETINKEIV